MRRGTLGALLVGALLAGAPASASEAPWTDSVDDGRGALGDVAISGRRDVLLCDLQTDDMRIGVEYTTSIGRHLLIEAGPHRGCRRDSVLFGEIREAMLCYGYDVNPEGGSLRWCNDRRQVR
ncbi:hypothetical protein ACGFIJ_17310 [Microbispora bryophytorum]|uniref:hypothetical protein n=1 Tax=Microbispora bryophytorum TaxID=1460882 RepID=UPI00372428CE